MFERKMGRTGIFSHESHPFFFHWGGGIEASEARPGRTLCQHSIMAMIYTFEAIIYHQHLTLPHAMLLCSMDPLMGHTIFSEAFSHPPSLLLLLGLCSVQLPCLSVTILVWITPKIQ